MECSQRIAIGEAQAVYGTVAPRGRSDLAAMVAGGAAISLFVVRRLLPDDEALQQLAGGLLGWTATLMFIFQPLAQLVRRPPPQTGGTALLYAYTCAGTHSLNSAGICYGCVETRISPSFCPHDTPRVVGSPGTSVQKHSLFGTGHRLSI